MQKVLYLIIVILVLTLLFFVLKPQKPLSDTSSKNLTPSITQSSKQTSSSPIKLVVKDKKLVSGSDTISVTQGEKVTLQITADEDEEFHLHGYDKMVELEKDKPATLTFTADTSGRFPFELEKSGTELGALEVQPK